MSNASLHNNVVFKRYLSNYLMFLHGSWSVKSVSCHCTLLFVCLYLAELFTPLVTLLVPCCFQGMEVYVHVATCVLWEVKCLKAVLLGPTRMKRGRVLARLALLVCVLMLCLYALVRVSLRENLCVGEGGGCKGLVACVHA